MNAMVVLMMGVVLAAEPEPAPPVPDEPAPSEPVQTEPIPGDSAPTESGEPPVEDEPAAEGLPSLDELLGLDEPGSDDPESADAVGVGGPAESPDDLGQLELDRELTQQAIADDFAQAIDLMDRAAGRLEERSDTSLVTRRLQQDALDRLDTLIENAEQQQSQQQQQQSSSGSQNQQPSPPSASSQQQQSSQESQAENDGESMAPAGSDAQLNPIAQAAEAAWGSLPQRLRDSLVQGAGDRFSETYRELTENYYRRLAEERER